jgi:hypothetical protein
MLRHQIYLTILKYCYDYIILVISLLNKLNSQIKISYKNEHNDDVIFKDKYEVMIPNL